VTLDLRLGDAIELMRRMPDASIDAVVCDPPYGLGFMGVGWDTLDGRQTGTQRRSSESRFDHVGGNHNPTSAADGARTARVENQKAQVWHEAWAREALRVLKPGGFLLAFGGTRTYHRLACGVEDAGAEIRDAMLYWGYGQGFPKSLDASKAINALQTQGSSQPKALRRARLGADYTPSGRPAIGDGITGIDGNRLGDDPTRYVPTELTSDAERWRGWGTALKPAHEPIIVARKPLAGTVAANVLAHGTGALNIDGTRIAGSWAPKSAETGLDSLMVHDGAKGSGGRADIMFREKPERESHDAGRWPANVVLSHTPLCECVGTTRVRTGVAVEPEGEKRAAVYGKFESLGRREGYADEDGMEEVEAWRCAPGCPVAELDRVSGLPKSGVLKAGTIKAPEAVDIYGARASYPVQGDHGGDEGGASRFVFCGSWSPVERDECRVFYAPKAAGAERHAGLAEFLPRTRDARKRWQQDAADRWADRARSRWPTVKPVSVMRWIVRLVVPPGGRVLDPFMGTGTTGIAALLEGFDFIGLDQDPYAFRLARARTSAWEKYGEQTIVMDRERELRRPSRLRERAERRARDVEATGQMGLL
jgi:DNA modification methylase